MIKLIIVDINQKENEKKTSDHVSEPNDEDRRHL